MKRRSIWPMKMEGHPDNVAAALYRRGHDRLAGSCEREADRACRFIYLTIEPALKVMAFIPSTPLATKKARTMPPAIHSIRRCSTQYK
jgi:homoserine kinase